MKGEDGLTKARAGGVSVRKAYGEHRCPRPAREPIPSAYLIADPGRAVLVALLIGWGRVAGALLAFFQKVVPVLHFPKTFVQKRVGQVLVDIA